MKKQFLETGKIVGTHGIKGMVRIQPWCDNYEFLKNIKIFYLDETGEKTLVTEKILPNGNVIIAKFKGIEDISGAEKLRNNILYINRSDVKLKTGSYFIQDLIGCRVFDKKSGEILGTISDVSQTGANDVWHISRGSSEYLIPVIPQVVNSVDTDNSVVIITPLKGIFDDED